MKSCRCNSSMAHSHALTAGAMQCRCILTAGASPIAQALKCGWDVGWAGRSRELLYPGIWSTTLRPISSLDHHTLPKLLSLSLGAMSLSSLRLQFRVRHSSLQVLEESLQPQHLGLPLSLPLLLCAEWV